MIPWIKRFLWDESAWERYSRALLLAAVLAWQQWRIEGDLSWGALLNAAAGGIAVLIGAGQKNEAAGGGARPPGSGNASLG